MLMRDPAASRPAVHQQPPDNKAEKKRQAVPVDRNGTEVRDRVPINLNHHSLGRVDAESEVLAMCTFGTFDRREYRSSRLESALGSIFKVSLSTREECASERTGTGLVHALVGGSP